MFGAVLKISRASSVIIKNGVAKLGRNGYSTSYAAYSESGISEADKVISVFASLPIHAHDMASSYASEHNEQAILEYTFEAQELIKAVRQGRMAGIAASDIKGCNFCSAIYRDTISGSRDLETLPKDCGVRVAWVQVSLEDPFDSFRNKRSYI